MEVVVVKQRRHLEAFWEGVKKRGSNWTLHPLIHTIPLVSSAQNVEKKKAEPKLRSVL